MRYVCSVCGYIYDETRESVPFADLPPSWKCPVCKAAKTAFAPEHRAEERPRPPEPPAAAPAAARRDGELWELSPGALAALLFGLFRSLSNVDTGFDFLAQLNLPSTVYNMLPYIISLLVLALTSSKSRAPKAEGIPYDKGSR